MTKIDIIFLFDLADLLVHGNPCILQLQVMHALAVHHDDASRNTDYCRIRRHRLQHNRARTNLRMITDRKRPQHLRTGSHHNIIADGRMALALFLARTAQSHPLIERDIPAKLRRLTDDDSRTMVNEKPLTDCGSGMDLNAREEAAEIRNHARQQHPAAPVKRMRYTMHPDCMQSRIAKNNLPYTACGRVPLKYNADILFEPRKKLHKLLPP